METTDTITSDLDSRGGMQPEPTRSEGPEASPEAAPQASDGRPDLCRDIRGLAYVEYLVVLCLVTVIGAVSVAGLGVPLLRLFRYARMILALPVP